MARKVLAMRRVKVTVCWSVEEKSYPSSRLYYEEVANQYDIDNINTNNDSSIDILNGNHEPIRYQLSPRTPFFQHNDNLRSLSIGDGSMSICNDSAKLLAAALSNGSFSLNYFHIICWNLDDMYSGQIISALGKHTELKTLDLYIKMGLESCVELSILIRNTKLGLEVLDLRGCEIVEEGTTALGDALGQNKTLKKLTLNDMGEVTSIGWGSLVRCLSNPVCSLEEIELNTEDSEHDIDDEVVPILANSLSCNTKLKSLEIRCNNSISNLGWQSFFERLRLSTSSLENLDFRYGAIDDIAVTLMVDVLTNMSSLKSLRLNGNNFITNSGWITISSLLQSPQCTLMNLQLGNNSNHTNVNDEVISSFANNLMTNKTLETLQFGTSRNAITSSGWNSLEKSLFNQSTIESIVNSNHTLHKAHYPHLNKPPGPHPSGGRRKRYRVASDKAMPYNFVCGDISLDSILKMNENSNKVEVVRQKVIRYMRNGGVNIETFVDMELEVLPSAIAWIGSNDVGISLLYCLAKNLPCLFDSDGKTNRKRKVPA